MTPTTVFILALSVLNLVDGIANRPNDGISKFSRDVAVKRLSLRNGRSQDSDLAAQGEERRLILRPPDPLHHGRGSGQYRGCLGLSQDEREAVWASTFQGEMPPCTILVQGTVVAGGDSSTSGWTSATGGGGTGSNVSGSSGNENSGSGSFNIENSGNSDYNGGVGDGGNDSVSRNDNSGSSGSNNESGYDGEGSTNNAVYSSSGSNSAGTSDNAATQSGSDSSSEYPSSNGGGTSSSMTYESGEMSDNGASQSGSGSSSESTSSTGGGTSSSESGSSSGSTYNSSGVDEEYDEYVEEGTNISNPLKYFNISDCGTYSNMWVWDLALTCENSTSLRSCQCSEASILYLYGAFGCPGVSGSPSCPANCPVCNTCMRLLGCSSRDALGNQRVDTPLSSSMTKILPIALGVAAAAASAIVGYFMYQYKNRNLASGGLGTNFIRQEPPLNQML